MRKHSTPSSASFAMLWASLGAEQQAVLAAVPVRHSRRACAGRCVGLTGKSTLAPLTKRTWFETGPSAARGTPQHRRIQRIPVPPWWCGHSSAPSAAGRTPTAPCPALGSAPALPLPTQGLGAGSPARAEEEEGSAWHDVCLGASMPALGTGCAWGTVWESVCMAASSWCGQSGCVP